MTDISGTVDNLNTPEIRLHIEYRVPDDLKPYVRNARKHPQSQIDKLVGMINEIGFLVPVIINEDDSIVAGHGRVLAAQQMAMKEIPTIKVTHLTERQRRQFIIFDNRIAEEATWDQRILNHEMKAIHKMGEDLVHTGFDDSEILKALPELGYKQPEIQTVEEQEEDITKVADVVNMPREELTGVYSLNPNVTFPSDNYLEIPPLDVSMMASGVAEYVWNEQGGVETPLDETFFTWHGIKGSHWDVGMGEGGIIGFYDDDFKFESIWNDPVDAVTRLRLNKWGTVIMPDFSIWEGQPRCLQIHQMYKAFWCARFFQEAGLKVAPNLTFIDTSSHDFCFAGIPKNAPVVYTQCRTMAWGKGDEEEQVRRRGMSIQGYQKAIESLTPEVVVFYGGDRHQEFIEPSLPDTGTRYVWIGSRMQSRLRGGK